MDTAERQRRKQLYYNLMQEIRWRLNSIFLIEGQLGKSLNTLQHFIANETYLLQLRMVFESIALGCMIVHGDIPITKSGKLTEFYQADKLLKHLSTVHPDFFPTPREYIAPSFAVPGAFDVGPQKAGHFLTKEEIIRLYGRFGEYLHRGKMKTFVAKQHDTLQPVGKEIGDVARGCRALLSAHTISFHDSQDLLACLLAPQVQVEYFSVSPQKIVHNWRLYT